MHKPRIEKYQHAAGGLDALKSSARFLIHHQIPVRGPRTLLSANQPDGFDCPGCAWPDKNHASSFEFCENGVKAVSHEATSKRVYADFFARHSIGHLVEQDDYYLEDQGRLTEPMLYDGRNDHYHPINWDDAFALIAQELNALPSPDEAIFYTSGRTSNEAAFLYQLFVREYGTNNLPDCSNMCHEPSGVALTEQIGTGKGTVTLDDFALADAIFVFGQNPGTNHPRMLTELRSARQRGARIVVFNPLRERGLERFSDPKHARELLTGHAQDIASHYFQPRIGGDLPLLIGMVKCLFEREAAGETLFDHAFIREHTSGFETLAASVAQSAWIDLEADSGLSKAQIEQAANIFALAPRVICTWGMGITQHQHAVATIQMIVNLLLLGGHIGREGAGACPVRGHSNVQGDRSMGIYEKPSQAFLQQLAKTCEFSPPQIDGYDVVRAIDAMATGKAKVFFALGGNFAAATPDTNLTQHALQNCRLTVHVSTKLNRSHLVHGKRALILPCLGRTEIDRQGDRLQAVSVEDSMSMVHLSVGINAPASEQLLSEPQIIARLAVATLGLRSKTRWLWLVEDYARIRDLIAQVIPGFEQFNRRLQAPGGFYLGNSARDRLWLTENGKAQLVNHALPVDSAIARVKSSHSEAVFTLATVRSHDQYNTTIYGMDDRYRGVYGQRRVLLISDEDLRAHGFADGQQVDILSAWDDGVERIATDFRLVRYALPAGCLVSYFPETNVLLALEHQAERAGTPASKAIPVLLRKRMSHACSGES